MNENDRWERDAMREIALEGIKERQRARRWGIFFKLAFLAYLVALLIPFASGFLFERPTGPHLAKVNVTGLISADELASAELVNQGLQAAFNAPRAEGVVLYINSPGGSPVQSNRIYSEINRLREQHQGMAVYAVIDDVGASGAYYIASAADEIFVNPASVVGSIGVISGGFGFTEAMEKLGVERRIYTAGENKAFLDPFAPEEEAHQAHMERLLEEVHSQFIADVRAGRGERLADDDRLFSGLIWTGESSVELGLADGFGDIAHVAREVAGVDQVLDYSRHPGLLRFITDRLGMSIGKAITRALTEGHELR
ncbi:S49 family peptidase [Alkalilimnicola ehrlichii MLHE-1]|uniref:Peptidase S49 n=1 Tax=Alkalilimnicola ehrlichii (strain ATCC BAA-1101 / DSM 17681 / MLHE-1) TaxID=187272 RepID=Q0A8R0_ALKEH|nr:S49 family peptidase [Alkalilimnicola ehrlichii]ABI56777.1 peptidase S49 [Alkalilimnicola ehrlichii MLHE-1]